MIPIVSGKCQDNMEKAFAVVLDNFLSESYLKDFFSRKTRISSQNIVLYFN